MFFLTVGPASSEVPESMIAAQPCSQKSTQKSFIFHDPHMAKTFNICNLADELDLPVELLPTKISPMLN